MKLAGLLLLEAVHACKDWTQSWVLMPCAGVTQVKALSAGLLLSTVHCVCTWKVMNRIKTPFIYFAHSGFGDFADPELQKLAELR